MEPEKPPMLVDEHFWDDILGHMKQGALVPVVGPELLTASDGGRQVTLSRLIGERLADRYKLSVGWTDQSGLDDAVRAYVSANGREKAERLYRVVNDILSDLTWPPPSRSSASLASPICGSSSAPLLTRCSFGR